MNCALRWFKRWRRLVGALGEGGGGKGNHRRRPLPARPRIRALSSEAGERISLLVSPMSQFIFFLGGGKGEWAGEKTEDGQLETSSLFLFCVSAAARMIIWQKQTLYVVGMGEDHRLRGSPFSCFAARKAASAAPFPFDVNASYFFPLFLSLSLSPHLHLGTHWSYSLGLGRRRA